MAYMLWRNFILVRIKLQKPIYDYNEEFNYLFSSLNTVSVEKIEEGNTHVKVGRNTSRGTSLGKPTLLAG